MSEAYLKLENLTTGYDKKPLIHDLNISLEQGKILALIGPNGAGKSTILKTLIKELTPIGGSIILNGRDLTELNDSDRAKCIASLLPGRVGTEYLTVEDVVSMGRYPYTGAMGLLSKEDKDIIRKTMEDLKVSEIADRDFACLSDGQRQRVLLARAMCQQPKLLVLDEPTSFLDIRYQLELVSTLRRMADTQQLTVVLSLHEIGLAGRCADMILCVKNGEIVKTGAPEEIFAPGFIEELFEIPEDVLASLKELPNTDVLRYLG